MSSFAPKLPLLCIGDFNETTTGLEHFSEHGREEWQMRNFREAIEDCDLQDLGYTGVPYTWDNKQPGAANVKARIDRALANEALLLLYPVFRVQHLSAVESDHCFVLASLQKQVTRRVNSGQHVFRYEMFGKLIRIMTKLSRTCGMHRRGKGGSRALQMPLRLCKPA
jgi:hypothetical protein